MNASLARACALALALGLAAAAGAQAAQALVTLRAQAVVPAAEVRLGDIAVVEADDEAAAAALRQLLAGRVGVDPARLARWELQRHVARHLPPGIDDVRWQGAEAVAVQLQTQSLDPQLAVARASEALRARLEPAYPELVLRPVGRLDPIRIPHVDHTLQARLPAGSELPRRRMQVFVDVVAQGRVLRTVPVSFDVQAWGDTAPAVARQDEVTVELRSGPVLIESRGTALADGRVGELVPVRTQGAGAVRARVVGSKRVSL